ncbi:DUF2252 family protein [Paraneptunicella aestuarii]|uniref:DUF2252 family protein n=1 Tax=Paraneptunicella aestuarii TaxID=2831148 RepID=UPI001E2C183E|nr:DUF2252 family protein [Paraneptunicella aestuarii]UAA38934.1 DUF2252 family protein [Paraneptunicella aestuarii]
MQRHQTICDELTSIDKVSPTSDTPLAKHKLMATNPFRFMRGSASLMYADLRSGFVSLPESLNSKHLRTCIVGDCHISNFGFFTEEGSHGDNVVFAPNDFDDACVGNASWDLLRFLVSLHLTVDYCQGLLAGEYVTDELESLDDFIAANNEELDEAQEGFLDAYICTCDLLIADPSGRQRVLMDFPKGHVLRKFAEKARKRAAGGKNFTSKSALAKAIRNMETFPVFNQPSAKLKPVSDELKNEIIHTFSPYVDDAILDVSERLGAGTGSVNMGRYYLLVGPQDYAGIEDLPLCHIVEIKQQRVAAPAQHFADDSPLCSPANRLNPAHLTVMCQQRMQRRPDLVLDDIMWQGKHWLVRSRHHAKVGIKPEHIGLAKTGEEPGLASYARTCGEALALAHCRGDRRSTRFEQSVVNTLPLHQDHLVSLAKTYAAQCVQDCALLKQIIADR